jgi:hypothetical protein
MRGCSSQRRLKTGEIKMSCSFRRTPSNAILAIASAFILGGMAPAINSNGDLLYQSGGGGCAAYLIATPEMQKIMATTTHQKHKVCDLRTDLNVRLHEVIDAPSWSQSERELFVQGLQNAHDKAAQTFKTMIDYGMDEVVAKNIFNFTLKSVLTDLANEYKTEIRWPKKISSLAHSANDNRSPSKKTHRQRILDRQTANG